MYKLFLLELKYGIESLVKGLYYKLRTRLYIFLFRAIMFQGTPGIDPGTGIWEDSTHGQGFGKLYILIIAGYPNLLKPSSSLH